MFVSNRLVYDKTRRDDASWSLLLMKRETANRVRFVAAGIVGLSIIVRYSLRLYEIFPCLAVNKPARGAFQCII